VPLDDLITKKFSNEKVSPTGKFSDTKGLQEMSPLKSASYKEVLLQGSSPTRMLSIPQKGSSSTRQFSYKEVLLQGRFYTRKFPNEDDFLHENPPTRNFSHNKVSLEGSSQT